MSALTREIRAARPTRNNVDPWRVHACFVEPECGPDRVLADVATLFLVNSECPFTCSFCDLWKNTLETPTPRGAIPAQIDDAFERLGSAARTAADIKLYNSGNFFDRRAVPIEDHPAIAERVKSFRRVIVENHPRLTGEDCLRFRDLIAPARLEVALGLETIHPEILPRLNKGMTFDDFARAAEFLQAEGVALRAFVMLRPPEMTEAEGVHWAERSLAAAFDCGVECCSVIPARAGNGYLDRLAKAGRFSPPGLASLEEAQRRGLAMDRGRVFADLWDAQRLPGCVACGPARRGAIAEMNRIQWPIPPTECVHCGE
ncbi:MAG: radical SAM protein [Planctomyces sp.]|nr:radical SAM protein [Planctomyces sp.]